LTATPKENNIPGHTIVSVSPADQLLQELNARATKDIKSVWLHIQEKKTFDTDTQNNGILPNGVAIPNEQINDTWYHVNDQGLVIESVSIMRTADGQIVQVGVSSNGTGWNSATDETGPQEQFKIEGLDSNFLNDLKWLEKFGDTAEITNVVLPNSNPGVQIVIATTYDTPVKTVDYSKVSTRAETRAVFDSSTGYLVSKDIVFWFEDGSRRIFSQLKQEITIEPPTDEVLNYLAEKDREVSK